MDDFNRIKKLSTPDGFESLFLDEINQDETYKDVFQRLNGEYEDFYGRPRYSCYHSFDSARRKRRG